MPFYSPQKKRASLAVIFLTVFIDLMGFGILIPILPTFASKELNISDFSIGFIVAIYSLIQFLFNPLLGRMSDKIGRRPIIIVTLLITSLSYILFAFANSFLILIVSRLLAGFGGSNIGVAQAYIADVTEKNNRSKGMGLIGAAFGLGFLFGPIIGGILSDYGYNIIGFGSAAFSLAAALFALRFLPESIDPIAKNKLSPLKFNLIELSDLRLLLKLPNIGLLVIIFFIIIFSVANIYGTFSLLGYKVYGFNDKQNSYLFGIMGIVSALIQGVLIKVVTDNFNDRAIIIAGTAMMVIGLGLLPYGNNFYDASLFVISLTIGTSLLQPVILSLISKNSPDNVQGSVLGLNQSVAALARVLGPLWGGFAFEYIGYEFPFLTGAFFTLITLLISIFYLKNNKI